MVRRMTLPHPTAPHPIDRVRLTALIDRERRDYEAAHPRSAELFHAADHLFGRVPMTWMGKWSGGFPLYLDRAKGNRITDGGGLEYVGFGLGCPGGMAGQRPEATVDGVIERAGPLGGGTAML